MSDKPSRLIIDEFNQKVDVEEIDKKIENDKKIPSSYVEIKLPSLGKYGCPKSLHFRDYSFSDVMDLNIHDETNQNLCKVLTNLNYEKFDVSKLSEKDVVVILYSLHKMFVSDTIEKKIYIDDSLEEGTEEGQLNHKDNIETVDISLSELNIQNLGYDENDDFIGDVKIPFTIKDTRTNDKIKLRIPILDDSYKATAYCKEFFKDELLKYTNIKTQLSKLQSIKDEEKQNAMFEEFYSKHEDECKEYYNLIERMTVMITKIVQAMQIVAFNDKECESLEEKLSLFNDKISSGVWVQYEKFLEKFNFGIVEDVNVFIPSLNKKVMKKIPFQFTDFIPTNDRTTDDRFVVEFD